jgi:hypothetical protein
VIPRPCIKNEKQSCCPNCKPSQATFNLQLEQLTKLINDGTIIQGITVADLEQLLGEGPS